MKGLCSLRSAGFWLLLLLLPSMAHAAAWREYSSDNFHIYSDDEPERCIELLKQFEVFRKVALTLTGLPNRAENTRMQVLVFENLREYKKIGPPNTAGFYFDTSRGPRMVIGPEQGNMESADILYHEYIHYLMREHSNLRYPRWYDEGFAEFLSAISLRDGIARIGEVPESREDTFTYLLSLSVRHLLEPDASREDSGRYQARFYAYSWLLVHYLQINAYSNDSKLQGQIRDFLVRYDAGEPPVAAFEASFGMTPEDMDKELQKYREQKRLTMLAMNIEDYQGEIAQRSLATNEAAWILGDLAYLVGEEDVALEYTKAIALEQADAAQAMSLVAVMENHKDNTGRARDFAERALALAPADAMVLTNLSHWEWDNYQRALEAGEATEQPLQQSLDYSLQAIGIDPRNLETYSFAWEAYAAQGEQLKALKTLMAAYQFSPSSIGINEAIGNLLFEMDKYALAEPFLLRVFSWSHSEEHRNAVGEKLEIIRAEEEAESVAQAES